MLTPGGHSISISFGEGYRMPLGSNEPLLTAEALTYYWDHAYDFVYDQIVHPARRSIPGLSITSQQKELLDEISIEPRIAIESGHGTGKSASLSWVGIWFLTTRFNTLGYPLKVPAVAPTYHQLMDILWPEFRRWIALSRLRLVMKVQHEMIFFDKYKTEGFVAARSPKKPENVQGFHAAHLLWLCDEAFGIIDDLVWETIEGSLTEEDNRIIIAGQHTMITGYCHEAFTRDKERWKCLRFSSEDSPLAKPEYAARIAQKYGRDSDIYRVRVSGMAPKGNPMSFIQLEQALRAQAREASRFGRVSFGVDVARFGDDNTVVTILAGNVVFPQQVRSKTDTDDICNLVIHMVYEFRRQFKYNELINVNVDATGGYGAGVIDQLSKDRENNIRVNPVNFTGRIDDPEYYDGVSKMWGELRDRIDELQLPEDDLLIEEVSTRRFAIDKGKVRIESKAEFKKEYGGSPDRADSLVLALTREAAPKRVWEGMVANEYVKNFVVDFHNLNDSSILVCSQWVEKDMRTYCLLGMWSARALQLYIMAEAKFNTPAPEVVVPGMNRLVQFISRDVAKNLERFEWYGNQLMFERTRGGTSRGGTQVSSMGDIREGYRRMDTYIQENTRYEEYGSIVLGGRMLSKRWVWIHDDCRALPREMELWHIDDRGRPAAGFGFSRAFCNMISSLSESGRLSRVELPMKEYSKKKTTNQRRIEEAAQQGKLGQLHVYGGLEKVPDKHGWIV